MNNLILEDAREYVFCLFLGEEDEHEIIQTNSLQYLGTAFFITNDGHAITAAHVLPSSGSLKENQHIYSIIKNSGTTQSYKLTQAAVFEQSDLALCSIHITGNPYLSTSFECFHAGTDVTVLGIPDHEIYQQGKELRLLKGHITLAAKPNFSELNIAILRGMSGGPVFEKDKCIGFLSANIRSETLEDQIEEIVEIEENKEKITFIESKSIINYGIFIPFSYFAGYKSEIFEGKSLDEYINEKIKT